MILKTSKTIFYLSRLLENFLLNPSEIQKLNNCKSCLKSLNGLTIKETNKIVLINARSLLISMNKAALNEYDYVLASELYEIIKTIQKF